MKKYIIIATVFLGSFLSGKAQSPQLSSEPEMHYYIDEHDLGPGSITPEAVAKAHQKDLETEGKYHVKFLKYWVNEKEGKVYCLSESPDPHSIYMTHKEAHGLVPSHIMEVTGGQKAELLKGGQQLYLDIHHFSPGSVTAEAAAAAHKKDLAVEEKYGVHFINYWVDVQNGVVMCLSEAPDSSAIINTHREAHGLLPDEIMQVKEGE